MGPTGTGIRRLASSLALLVLAVAAIACGGDGSGGAAATPVVLEGADDVGENPFTASVAEPAAAGLPAAITAAADATLASATADEQTGGVTTTGATPGLYGGTGDTAVCNVETLVGYLTDPAHSDKAEAFAGVLGIGPDVIAATLATFTPVVLTVDTLVTNHGFRDGRATAFPAVLQAGTAVLVDVTGTPRVKCGCGNPLTPPPTEIDLTDTTGDAWDGFSAATTASVTPSPAPLDAITVIDVETGASVPTPVGGGTSATTTTTTTAPPSDGIELRPDGLGVVAFGTPREEAEATLTGILGPPESTIESPPGGPLDEYASGPEGTYLRWWHLTAYFDPEGAFGWYRWDLTQDPLLPPEYTSTPEGLHVGDDVSAALELMPITESITCDPETGEATVGGPTTTVDEQFEMYGYDLSTGRDGYVIGIEIDYVTAIGHAASDTAAFTC